MYEKFLTYTYCSDMEDSHTEILSLKEDKGTAFFGVYDGHGGRCYYNSRCIIILALTLTVAMTRTTDNI